MLPAGDWAGETAPAEPWAGEHSADWHAIRLRQGHAAVRMPQSGLPLLQVNAPCKGKGTGLILDHHGSLPTPTFQNVPPMACLQEVMLLDLSKSLFEQ